MEISAPQFVIIGGGLAGCECALALARAGIASTIYEQKPEAFSPAHVSEGLGELVCSNSFRSNDVQGSGVGLLKQEMRELGSEVMAIAETCSVPAGKALAVDRELFSQRLTQRVEDEPLITLVRRQIASLDDPELVGKTVILAAGPLVSENLAASLASVISADSGPDRLYFYDAIAPIVRADSVDMSIAFRGSRYGNDAPPPYSDDAPMLDKPMETMTAPSDGDGDYLNCPMTRAEYETFYKALLEAERVPSHDFEKEIHFEGCMPIEALADRGERTLTFGPLKPVGLTDPKTGKEPYAVVQLRQDNAAKSVFNLVGFQTHLKFGEQKRVFSMIPALKNAEFVRYGVMHRNTFLRSPGLLDRYYSDLRNPMVAFAGQMTGVEGYVESTASGLLAAIAMAARIQGREVPEFPKTTAIGALGLYISDTSVENFQPMNVNFSIISPLEQRIRKKAEKNLAIANRSLAVIDELKERGAL